jgi:hypothetical protein
MALFAVLTLGLAVGPMLWLARARAAGPRHLLAAASVAATMSGSALLAGPWVLLSVDLRPVILAALVVVLLVAAFRTGRGTRQWRHPGAAGRRLTWQNVTAFVFGLVLADAVAGRIAPAGAVDLSFPLEADGEYAVLQGGNSLALNPFHHWFASDEHAVDIVKLAAFGNRARRLVPGRLTDYATFDAAVRGPCTGVVEFLEDDLPDHAPGEMDWQHPPGNHVLLRCGPVRILLAHLRQGSVVVSAGERILAGQLVARIGNSGGTREPHLHIGAMDALSDESFPAARAVPVTFGGRYLRINDVIDPTSPP